MALVFLCGKMAAGKSTLARELARRQDAVLLVERGHARVRR
jgi:shikimate kinase